MVTSKELEKIIKIASTQNVSLFKKFLTENPFDFKAVTDKTLLLGFKKIWWVQGPG